MPVRAAAGIAVHDVSKRFLLSGRPDTLRELLPAAARALSGRRRNSPTVHWALRDVSFSVKPGQTLGVIGRNGAGKSTLLRLLSRILLPTSGRVEVRGRVAALIELSAGFHFDLTARENIHLQGAIYGMRRAEIAPRIDAIVDFAGLADFVDVPLKRYSTGMVSRLGFAIAAQVDADVLLIDEVLAVGDLAFQRKAVAHLEGMVRDGRPVVLVSHQLDRIAELCSHAILLRDGRIAAAGTPVECIASYTALNDHHAGSDPEPLRIDDFALGGTSRVRCGERVVLRLRGTAVPRSTEAAIPLGLRVHALPSEEIVFATHTGACGLVLPRAGPFDVEIALDMNVGPGLYRLDAVIGDPLAGRPCARGAAALLRVERASQTAGRTFLNPAMRLIAQNAAALPEPTAPDHNGSSTRATR